MTTQTTIPVRFLIRDSHVVGLAVNLEDTTHDVATAVYEWVRTTKLHEPESPSDAPGYTPPTTDKEP